MGMSSLIFSEKKTTTTKTTKNKDFKESAILVFTLMFELHYTKMGLSASINSEDWAVEISKSILAPWTINMSKLKIYLSRNLIFFLISSQKEALLHSFEVHHRHF